MSTDFDKPAQLDTVERELNALRNSREFLLGTRLHQSKLLKLVRHYRLRDQLVRISVLSQRNPNASASEVCLLGVWYEYFPDGMPLDLLERDQKKWIFRKNEGAPYGKAIIASQEDTLCVYTRDENLHLDFVMDENSGQIAVEAHGQKITVDLYCPQRTIVSIYPNRSPIGVEVREVDDTAASEENTLAQKRVTVSSTVNFSSEHLKWIEQQRENRRPVSLNHPDWHGIRSSAQHLFDNVLTIPDTVDKERAVYYASLLREAEVPSITIQGFPKSYYQLVKTVRKMLPALPIYVIYHGNFMHFREDYDWAGFKIIKSLYDDGDITRVGFVKKGMAEIFAAQGMRTGFVMNIIRQIPEGPSTPLDQGRCVGIWGQPDWSWKKSPYAMLAALKLVPNATGYLYNVSPRAREFADMMDIPAKAYFNSLPHEQTLKTLAQMHLNLYVSLTECAPMLPLESLSVGSPCLLGPTSHYFLDNDYLFQRLVVPQPDNAEIISQYINRALEDRDTIIRAYQQYAPGYNAQALQALAEFLEFPVHKKHG